MLVLVCLLDVTVICGMFVGCMFVAYFDDVLLTLFWWCILIVLVFSLYFCFVWC